jgi:ABC-type lipopolysaccharide export system ATPase subunit
MILADNLVKKHIRKRRCQGISVEVNQGEIVGLGTKWSRKNNFYMIVVSETNSGNIYLMILILLITLCTKEHNRE